MKRLLTILLLLCSFPVFATSWNVVSVTGTAKVLKEGEWVKISVGDVLQSEDVVTTALNSTFIIDSGTRKVSVKPMRKGTVTEVIRVKATMTKLEPSNIAPATKSSQPVITAASRASEAKEDLDWEE